MDDDGSVYTFANSGATVKTTVGKPLRIRLEGNPTTGHIWRQRKQPGLPPPLTLRSAYRVGQPGVLGSGGVYTFTAVPTAPGNVTLTLDYMLPWPTSGDGVEKTFTLHLQVA